CVARLGFSLIWGRRSLKAGALFFWVSGSGGRERRQQIPVRGKALRGVLVPRHKDCNDFVADFFRRHSIAGFRVACSDEPRQEIFWLRAWFTSAAGYQFIDCFIEFAKSSGGTAAMGKNIPEPCREAEQIEQ